MRRRVSALMALVLLMVVIFSANPIMAYAGEGTITVTYDSGKLADVLVGGRRVENNSVQGYVDGDIQNEIKLSAYPGNRIDTITINGTDVTSSFSISDDTATGNVDAANNYNISVTIAETNKKTIVWTYTDDPNLGPEALVENGKVEVVSVNGSAPVRSFVGPICVHSPAALFSPGSE